MWRENREYAITAQSDITEGLQGATVTKQLLPALNALQAKWAQNGFPAYTISVAGAVEESSKGSASIAAGIPLVMAQWVGGTAASKKLVLTQKQFFVSPFSEAKAGTATLWTIPL